MIIGNSWPIVSQPLPELQPMVFEATLVGDDLLHLLYTLWKQEAGVGRFEGGYTYVKIRKSFGLSEYEMERYLKDYAVRNDLPVGSLGVRGEEDYDV